MKRNFVFCHGFGFDPSFWQNLAPFFPKESCFFLDLGYFDRVVSPSFEDDEGAAWIGIGHSLGLLKLLKLEKKFQALIGLNGFVNFLGMHPERCQERAHELLLLKERFETDPRATLQRFYRRCGLSQDRLPLQTAQDSFNKQRLSKDLDFLHQKAALPQETPLLIIGAQNDLIVPPSLLEDNFKMETSLASLKRENRGAQRIQIHMKDKGKHALGFLEAKDIYETILGFLNDILPENR